jgi:hypothetical protein
MEKFYILMAVIDKSTGFVGHEDKISLEQSASVFAVGRVSQFPWKSDISLLHGVAFGKNVIKMYFCW